MNNTLAIVVPEHKKEKSKMIASILYFDFITMYVHSKWIFSMPSSAPKIMRKPYTYIVQPNSL